MQKGIKQHGQQLKEKEKKMQKVILLVKIHWTIYGLNCNTFITKKFNKKLWQIRPILFYVAIPPGVYVKYICYHYTHFPTTSGAVALLTKSCNFLNV